MSKNIVLVGAGNMGFAMLAGWLKASGGTSFHVVEPNEELRERAAKEGAKTYANIDEIPDLEADLIFLAVKPQVMGEVVPPYSRFSTATFVSIAAGTTVASLTSWLGDKTAIIRTMPNTPAAIGEGMMVSYANPHTSKAAKEAADRLLSASGETGWIEDEALMDAVTAISGSGPAYVFHFIEVLAEAAEALGLAPELSRKLALQTVKGAGLLAQSSEDDPGTLRQKVTSPGGTTAAALNVFMGPLGELTKEATKAANDRGVELGKA